MKNIFLAMTLFTSLQISAQLRPVAYQDGEHKLNGLSSKPAKPKLGNPGILILPAWMGIDTHAKSTAEKLAKSGYFAFVADIYGEGNYPKDSKKAGEMSGYYKKNVTEYHQRIQLALQQLIKSGANPDKIVVIGYCFGGTGAIEAARMNFPIKGVVSFHGGLGRDATRTIETIRPKVLICHGADDPSESQERILAFQNEMRTAKADWQMIYYANAVHAFTDETLGSDNSKGAAYNALADKRSWQHMMVFLQEVL